MLESQPQQIQYFLVIEDNQGKRVTALEATTYSLGRDLSNSIVLHSKLVSRQHAILMRLTTPETNNYVFRLIDINLQGKRSTNGIIVNGQRCFSQDLKHGDIIAFGKEAKARFFATSNRAELESLKSSNTEDISGILSSLNDPFSTLIAPELNPETSVESTLIRLASFPELLANPIIEITLSGTITYLNPAAIGQFPGIAEIKSKHPIIVGLTSTVQRGKEKFFIREVEYDQKVFEQSVHYIAASDLIRSHIVDITERKQIEVALRQAREELELRVQERTAELSKTNEQLRIEIDERQRAELALFQANEALEIRVQERTTELTKINASLQAEINKRQQIEKSLRESEERYALAARGANDGLWDWNLKTKQIYFSPRWKSMLGYSEENDIGNSMDEWSSRIHPDDAQQVKEELLAHLLGQTPHFENEHRMRHHDGSYRWMLSRGLAVRNASGNAYRIAGSQTDITERKQAESQLRHDALHDGLTGLPNRALFMDRLERALKHAKRHQDYLFAVLFLDLDRFKIVNDSLGHLVGDQLLVAIARRLEQFLRAEDTVARLGGDEFAILLENIRNAEDTQFIVDSIRQSLMLPFNLNGHEVFSSASIGMALSTLGYEVPEDMLRDADTTMYHVKAQGKGDAQVSTQTMQTQVMKPLRLETDLHQALARREFRLYYQPIISLQTSQVIGFEALLRWQHPQLGLLAPAEFIKVAEETGLLIPIDQWTLREACYQAQQWQEQIPGHPPLSISVNFCRQQLTRPELIEQISQILQETGLEPSSLRLELTESMMLENVESVIATLLQLRDLGIHLSIDDFGSDCSSLSRLHSFPIDMLKIDRSFISCLDVAQSSTGIVETIVTLTQKLGITVTAEGIETVEQLEQLRALKCEYGQGYLFSQPLDSSAAEALLVTA